MEPVPVTGFAANFSPIPRIAPPPLGRLMLGGWIRWLPAWLVLPVPAVALPEPAACQAPDGSPPENPG